MLLILTNSLDGTTDELVRRIGSKHVFRFNLDMWGSYTIRIDQNGFTLRDPVDRICHSADVKAMYLRKPSFDSAIDVPAGGCVEAWTRAQMSYVTREVCNWCRGAGIVRLVEQDAERRFGKLMQLQLAAKFLEVPEWIFLKAPTLPAQPWPCIAKALTADFIEEYRVMFTRYVEPMSLDPAYPWLLQRLIAGGRDVTVVYVKGRCFAFALERSTFEGHDWRKHISGQHLEWHRLELPGQVLDGIGSFMQAAGLQFGRIDMIEEAERYYFLEVNPNGQWGWLDEDGSQGLFDAVIHELTVGWL